MGTTLVAALADGEEALILNEGDSRAYHLSEEGRHRPGDPGPLPWWRTWSRGESSPGSRPAPIPIKPDHPGPGAEPELRADVFRQPLAAGDYLLLCSDGLSNVGVGAGAAL